MFPRRVASAIGQCQPFSTAHPKPPVRFPEEFRAPEAARKSRMNEPAANGHWSTGNVIFGRCGERFDRRRCMSVGQVRCGIGARRSGFSCWSDRRSKPSDRDCRHRAQDGPSAEALLLRPEGGEVCAGLLSSPPGWAWPIRCPSGLTPALERLDDDHMSPRAWTR